MIRELKTFEYICEGVKCARRMIVQSSCEQTPAGWEQVPEYDCGSTGYTRYDLLCPRCAAARKKSTTSQSA